MTKETAGGVHRSRFAYERHLRQQFHQKFGGVCQITTPTPGNPGDFRTLVDERYLCAGKRKATYHLRFLQLSRSVVSTKLPSVVIHRIG